MNLINKRDTPSPPRTKIVPIFFFTDTGAIPPRPPNLFTDLAKKKKSPEKCSKYCLPTRAKSGPIRAKQGTKRTKDKAKRAEAKGKQWTNMA